MFRVGKQFRYLFEEAGVIILAASVLDSNDLRYDTLTKCKGRRSGVHKLHFPMGTGRDR